MVRRESYGERVQTKTKHNKSKSALGAIMKPVCLDFERTRFIYLVGYKSSFSWSHLFSLSERIIRGLLLS